MLKDPNFLRLKTAKFVAFLELCNRFMNRYDLCIETLAKID